MFCLFLFSYFLIYPLTVLYFKWFELTSVVYCRFNASKKVDCYIFPLCGSELSLSYQTPPESYTARVLNDLQVQPNTMKFRKVCHTILQKV